MVVLVVRGELHQALQRGEMLAQVKVAAEAADQLVDDRVIAPAEGTIERLLATWHALDSNLSSVSGYP